MKRYLICLFLFIVVSVICVMAGVSFVRRQEREERASAAQETSLMEKTEADLPDGYPAVNQGQVAAHEAVGEEIDADGDGIISGEYYLVCVNGFLLVFQKDRETVCLYTHIPITDFPAVEQERLRNGIGFSSMLEVLHYLESYTS